jgi:plastocyanin
MRFSRREFLILSAGLLAACGTTGREPDYTVVMKRPAVFEPASLSIPAGSIVAWQNRSENIHTVTADPAKAMLPERVVLPAGVSPFDSGDIFAGERWVYTFEVPGTYVYFCRYHELDEMIGIITVTA